MSGFYIFKQNDWKLIVDAGQPGPAYIPGHAHCDAMSFELFKAGEAGDSELWYVCLSM